MQTINVQIFGKNKCFGTRAAERFFRERRVAFSFVNLAQKPLSARELDNILQSIGNIDLLFDTKSPLYESMNIAFISRGLNDKKELLIAHPTLLKTPIVRNCTHKKCTVGQAEDTWKDWLKN